MIFFVKHAFLYPYWMEIEVHKQKIVYFVNFYMIGGITKEELSSNFNRMSNKNEFSILLESKTYKSLFISFQRRSACIPIQVEIA